MTLKLLMPKSTLDQRIADLQKKRDKVAKRDELKKTITKAKEDLKKLK